ncbi:MAG: GatB/YqeY domain-containing protein [Parcubacteria group bacterium]|nr:GatB/YqeY domain-containing protein [Parcubacteria group bacterium]
MSLQKQIATDFKTHYKAKNEAMFGPIRMLVSAIKQEEVDRQKREQGLSDDEVTGIIRREIKRREDAAQSYEQGGRPELAEKEKKEIEIFRRYLPVQMTEDEIMIVVQKIVAMQPTSEKPDFGKIMGMVMKEVKGKADGNIAAKAVKEFLKKP